MAAQAAAAASAAADDGADELVAVLPDAATAAWRDNPAAAAALAALTDADLASIEREPARLAREKERILRETQTLAFKNYKAFIHTAQCSKDIFNDFTSIADRAEDLLVELPQFSEACKSFAGEAKDINSKRRLNSLTLQHHSQLLEILEIPQLMDTCVRNEYYEEALQLQQHVVRMRKKHGKIPVIRSIADDVQLCTQQMLAGLLTQLRGEVQLPACLRIVGHLRSLDAFTPTELRVQFLLARGFWLDRTLAAIPTSDTYTFLTKTIETSRVHLFDIVTQYKAVFSHTTDVQEQSMGILHGWVLRRVAHFLQVLEHHLQFQTDRISSILSQAMHFALSLGRVGVDFRVLLTPIFERCIARLFEQRIQAAAADFVAGFDDMSLSPHSATSEASTQDSSTLVPLSLMSHPPLAELTNAFVGALNELRECAPLGIAGQAAETLRREMTKLAHELEAFHSRNSQTYYARELSVFAHMCGMFAGTFVHSMIKCLRTIYPTALFKGHVSSTAACVSPADTISLPDIIAPLAKICPSVVAAAAPPTLDAAAAAAAPGTSSASGEVAAEPAAHSESAAPAESAAAATPAADSTSASDDAPVVGDAIPASADEAATEDAPPAAEGDTPSE